MAKRTRRLGNPPMTKQPLVPVSSSSVQSSLAGPSNNAKWFSVRPNYVFREKREVPRQQGLMQFRPAYSFIPGNPMIHHSKRWHLMAFYETGNFLY